MRKTKFGRLLKVVKQNGNPDQWTIGRLYDQGLISEAEASDLIGRVINFFNELIKE